MPRPPSTVLITGCSTGIGEASALALAERGWRVWAGVRSAEDGARLAQRAGPQLSSILLDVTDSAAIEAARVRLASELGPSGLDGLVNNAGIAVGGPLEYLPLDQLRLQLEVNVIGLVAVTQAVLPMLRAARGRIVNIGSVAGRVTSPLVGAYCASKHAVEAITDALRLELAEAGIEVSVVEPGVVRTAIWDKGMDGFDRSLAQLPAEGRDRYEWLMRGLHRFIQGANRRGVPAAQVAEVVVLALESVRPRTRYLVGTDAQLRARLRFLPDRWMDRAVLRVMRRMSARSRPDPSMPRSIAGGPPPGG